jgi:hypothetical protein
MVIALNRVCLHHPWTFTAGSFSRIPRLLPLNSTGEVGAKYSPTASGRDWAANEQTMRDLHLEIGW